MPTARIERATSPLPRECSTTELQRRMQCAGPVLFNIRGAGEGNRTLVISLEGFCSTIELHPPWNALRTSLESSPGKLSQPNHPNFAASARPRCSPGRSFASSFSFSFPRRGSEPMLQAGLGGGGWIRTNVGARPTDLQSAPFSRSGTPPAGNRKLSLGNRGLSNRRRLHINRRELTHNRTRTEAV